MYDKMIVARFVIDVGLGWLRIAYLKSRHSINSSRSRMTRDFDCITRRKVQVLVFEKRVVLHFCRESPSRLHFVDVILGPTREYRCTIQTFAWITSA